MTKRVSLVFLSVLLLLVPCSGVHAAALGIAGEYNLFMFGDIFQWDTDVEGRVAAGGNVVYGLPGEGNGFAVASKVQDPKGLPDLVAGGSVGLTNGSVGYFAQENSGAPAYQKGTIVYGKNAHIAPNVGYGSSNQGNPIDFKSEQSYLQGMSAFWGGLSPNGKSGFSYNDSQSLYRIQLTGGNDELNVFTLDANVIGSNLGFYIDVPLSSTVLVNISGSAAKLVDFGFYFRDWKDVLANEEYIPGSSDFYPHSQILFNFLDAETLFINQIEINGSILAPYASVLFGKQSHIDGNLIANNLFGRGESHNILFNGNLPVQPVPEPATMLLLAGGLLGMAAWRRRS